METKIDKLEEVKVEYCGICTMPYEYCSYSGKSCSKEKAEEPKEDVKEVETKKEEIKEDKPGFLIKVLLHQKKNRGITMITNLEPLGVDNKKIGKKMSKKFGCGTGPINKDSIELQGLYKDSLVEFLAKELKELKLTEDNFAFEDKIKNQELMTGDKSSGESCSESEVKP